MIENLIHKIKQVLRKYIIPLSSSIFMLMYAGLEWYQSMIRNVKEYKLEITGSYANGIELEFLVVSTLF